jgi:D-alanyl-D-alanine carboxypeptidase
MTSGLFNTTEDCRLNAITDRYPHFAFTVPQTLAFAFKHQPYFPPGEGFHYANTNFDILGEMIERVTNKSLPDVFREQILAPLGLHDTALPPLRHVQHLPDPYSRGYQFGSNTQLNDAYLALLGGDLDAQIRLPRGTAPNDATFWNLSYTWASGAARSTLADMATWVGALVEGTLLPPWLQRQRLQLVPGTNYGMGIAEVVPGFMGHSGAVSGFQAVIGYSTERRATIVVLANSIVAPNTPFLRALPADRMAGTIQQALFPAAAAASARDTAAPATAAVAGVAECSDR